MVCTKMGDVSVFRYAVVQSCLTENNIYLIFRVVLLWGSQCNRRELKNGDSKFG
jgi:hypothetical protein